MVANLKMIREKKGLSQQALADILEISQQSINKYENHETEPDIAMLIKMADFFAVSVDFLIDHTTKDDSSAEEVSLVSKYRLLSKAEQDSILAVMDNYINPRK